MLALPLLSLAAALATAKPIEKRIIAQEFDVSSFYAGCIPHGTLCTYSFQVATNQDPFPTTCNASFTTAFVLPEVPFTACNDSNYIWSFRAVGLSTSSTSNYTLVLAHAAEGLAAAKIWDAAEFPTLTSGATSYPQYTGPTSFVIS